MLDQLALHGGARVRVERGERLVHQQHWGSLASTRAIWMRCFMPPDSSAGYLWPWPFSRRGRDSGGPARAARRAAAAHAQPELDVPERRQPRNSESSPWNTTPRSAPGPTMGHRRSRCSGRSRLEAGQHVEHRGLAAAARAQQAEELAGLDVQIEIAHGNVVAALHGAKDLVDAREPNQRQGYPPNAKWSTAEAHSDGDYAAPKSDEQGSREAVPPAQ